jgi:hypothetical protein
MTKGKPKDGTKNPGGRPALWTPEAIESLADNLIDWAKSDSAMFMASFCKKHGIHRQRLTDFSGKNEKFMDALKRAQNVCEANIAEKTANGSIPPAFGIFGLKQHSWTDKKEVEHSGEIKSKVTQVNLPTKKNVEEDND